MLISTDALVTRFRPALLDKMNECLVSCRVAVPIINRFEIIDIDEEELEELLLMPAGTST